MTQLDEVPLGGVSNLSYGRRMTFKPRNPETNKEMTAEQRYRRTARWAAEDKHVSRELGIGEWDHLRDI